MRDRTVSFEADSRTFELASFKDGAAKALWNEEVYFPDPVDDPVFMEARKRARKDFAGVAGTLAYFLLPPPEIIDSASHQITAFNDALIDALKAIGVPAEMAEAVFNGAGMPSDWRGALSVARSYAQSARRRKSVAELAACVEAVCRFLPLAMRYARSSFAWTLACATCILRDASGNNIELM